MTPSKRTQKVQTSRQYKFGISIATAIFLAVVGWGLWQWSLMYHDQRTNRQASAAADKINAYIDKHKALPADLRAAGVTNPPAGVTYSRQSDKRFQFCVTYRVVDHAAWSDSSLADPGSQPANSLYISTYHDKGKQCQTVEPYQLTDSTTAPAPSPSSQLDRVTDPQEVAKASGGQDSVCSLKGYATHYAGQVTAVKTADGQPVVPTVDQNIIITVKPLADAPAGNQDITLTNSSANVFNTVCTAMSHQSITVNDYVSVFQDNSGAYMPDAIADFSR